MWGPQGSGWAKVGNQEVRGQESIAAGAVGATPSAPNGLDPDPWSHSLPPIRMSIQAPLLDNARRLAGAETQIDETALRGIQQIRASRRVARNDGRVRVLEVVAIAGRNQRECRMQRADEAFARRSAAAVVRHLDHDVLRARRDGFGDLVLYRRGDVAGQYECVAAAAHLEHAAAVVRARRQRLMRMHDAERHAV